jgi:hypothetical protein
LLYGLSIPAKQAQLSLLQKHAAQGGRQTLGPEGKRWAVVRVQTKAVQQLLDVIVGTGARGVWGSPRDLEEELVRERFKEKMTKLNEIEYLPS